VLKSTDLYQNEGGILFCFEHLNMQCKLFNCIFYTLYVHKYNVKHNISFQKLFETS